MRKNKLFKRLASFAIVFLMLSLVAATNADAQQGAVIKTLVIDAGHGGKDPGAIGPSGRREAHLALAIALKFGALIEKHYPKIKIIYTRKTDVFLTLNERADIANKAKADLFFSIHLNSSTNKLALGSSTYALGLHRTEENLEAAKRENGVIELEEGGLKNYEFDPNSPEGHIIMSMKQNAFLEQSLKIASFIEDEQVTVSKRKSRGVKQAGFYVLYKTSMPSILTEIGFISNPEEEAFMASERGQQLIALSLFKGFLKYKNEIEGKNEKIDISDLIPKETQPEKVDTAKKPNEPNQQPKDSVKTKPAVLKDTVKTIQVIPATLKDTIAVKQAVPVQPKPVQKTDSAVLKPAQPKPDSKPLVAAENPSVKNQDNQTIFRIQIVAGAAYPKNRKEVEAAFGTIYTETLPNGIIRYMIGNYSNVKEARQNLPKAREMGFADAFITAYENMQRVSNKRLAELLK